MNKQIEHLLVSFSTVRETKNKDKHKRRVVKEKYKCEVVSRSEDIENIKDRVRRDMKLKKEEVIQIDEIKILKIVGYAN